MFLMCFQFVPIIRHKARMFHRINGYVIITLAILGNAGVLMIARRAFGGEIPTQVVFGVLVILTTFGLGVSCLKPRSLWTYDLTKMCRMHCTTSRNCRSNNIVRGCYEHVRLDTFSISSSASSSSFPYPSSVHHLFAFRQKTDY